MDRLLDDVAPPQEHGEQHEQEARHRHPGRNAVHEEHPADGQHTGGDRTDQGPGAGIHQVVGVVRLIVACAHVIPRS
jgi:hypothetical protein